MPSGSNFMSEANKVKGQKLRVSESVNKRKKGTDWGSLYSFCCATIILQQVLQLQQQELLRQQLLLEQPTIQLFLQRFEQL